MASLQLEDPTFAKGVFIPAAGVPWFVTLFGRDSLVVSMQGISGYPEFAAGALRRLSELQATARRPRARHGAGQDPARDPPRRARPAAHPAVPAVLRHARRDEPVRDRHLVPLPMARRRRRPGALPAERRGGAALDRPVGRPRPRRLPGVQDPLDARLLQPGLEGRRRRDPARRRLARAAAARAVRAAGLRLRREAADGRHLRDPRATRARARGCAPRRASCTTASTTRSGGRPRAPTTSVSTATSDRSRASPPMPGTAWRAASCRRSGRAGSSSA